MVFGTSLSSQGERAGSKGEQASHILAPAKLNLYLELLGPRADGYHALETLMVPVRIFDELSWQSSGSNIDGELSLQVRSSAVGRISSSIGFVDNQDNLVVRAAQLLADRAGIKPYGRFTLTKRIPIEAGMGGGSSDAAATLLLANRAWGLNYTQQDLEPLAEQLGSDVPFFLGRGPAVCRGRGEIVEPVGRLPKLHFVIAKPKAGLSTAEVFGQVAKRAESPEAIATQSGDCLDKLISAMQKGSLAESAKYMKNRLENAAARLAPWLQSLQAIFAQLRCVTHFMTGSGSAYVGVMRSARQARQAAGLLAHRGVGRVFATSSCNS